MKFKVGDRVIFKCLTKPGPVGVAEFGYKEGIIEKIKKAGELGARAMDCSMDTMIYYISVENILYPKFECELIRSGVAQ